MSQKELDRLKAMQQIEEKRLKQREAAKMLRISERHVRRILRSKLTSVHWMKISKTGMQIAFPRFMLCAVCVQIEYQSMENMDTVNISKSTYK